MEADMKPYSFTILILLWLIPCQGLTQSGGSSEGNSYSPLPPLYGYYIASILVKYENGYPCRRANARYDNRITVCADSNGVLTLCIPVKIEDETPNTRDYYWRIFKDASWETAEVDPVWAGNVTMSMDKRPHFLEILTSVHEDD